MSFFADFSAALVADLSALLRLPTGVVYVGRAPQRVTPQGLEVWIQPLDVEAHATGNLHAFDLHLRLRSRRDGALTGGEQLARLRREVERVRLRYDGTRPFTRTVPALVATQVEDAVVDAEPEDADLLEIALRLKALEWTA